MPALCQCADKHPLTPSRAPALQNNVYLNRLVTLNWSLPTNSTQLLDSVQLDVHAEMFNNTH